VDTREVSRRVTSQTLIGRTDQVAALTAALDAAAAGESRIVLVSGDAGIGKTRLVHEAVDRARAAGTLTATGGAVQLGEVSIAFAPLVEALRDVRRRLGDDLFHELAGPGRGYLHALLTGDTDAAASGGLFEHVLAFLNRLGAHQPLLLVLEDLHWADASTRDLITYLGRNLRTAAVTLVLTVRADELHRRHPLRPVIAGLERDNRVERIDLTGLSRAEIGRLLDEIGADADECVIDEVHARSGGNPFYVEELVAAGRVRSGLPETLAEVILTRIEPLPEDVRRLLRAAAVIDDHVDDELVAAVTGQPATDVTAALRLAVDEQVLVLERGRCRFRHALVREALYDDLLPGERTRLHVATAGVLEAVDHLAPHTRWAMVAYHWDAGRDAAKAYVASVRAGTEAEKVHAFADAAEQYERALSLRDRVDDPDGLAGLTLADLLLRAADAVQASSRSSRALVLAEAALREMGPAAEPERRARVLERIGITNWTLHHGPAAVAAYEQATALVADRPASADKAKVLAMQGRSLMVRGLYSQAIPVLREAIAVAAEVGATAVEGHARCSLGPCLAGRGQVDDAYAELHRALALSAAAGSAEDVSRAYTNLSHCSYQSGRFAETADLAGAKLDWVISSGYVHHHGEAIAGNIIAALHAAGDWARADAVHTDPRIPHGDPYQELRWLPLAFDAGRLDEARAGVKAATVATADADDVQFGALSRLMVARLAVVDERWDDARSALAAALPLIEATDEHFYRTKAYALGIRVEAEHVAALAGSGAAAEVEQARAVADDLLARLQAAVTRFRAEGIALLPEPAAWLVTADAEHARAHGRDEPAHWAAAATAWQAAGQPLRRAGVRFRQAAALVDRGATRPEVADLLRDCLETAEQIGARPLAGRVRRLARAARVDLSPDRGQRAPGPLLDVTPRELDVLRLVAQGRTNRQIGELLFISEKTASVHVTNLLRKLGVASRVEAAALAVRTGVADGAG
jgi:DNA-binding CsgD family transcriptional regulator/tetratricopeptide (TPR) repeat protein